MMSSAQRDGDEEPGRDMRSPGNFASLKVNFCPPDYLAFLVCLTFA